MQRAYTMRERERERESTPSTLTSDLMVSEVRYVNRDRLKTSFDWLRRFLVCYTTDHADDKVQYKLSARSYCLISGRHVG